MKKSFYIRRGDVYYADLSPVYGSEQGGIRPVLVIQKEKATFLLGGFCIGKIIDMSIN